MATLTTNLWKADQNTKIPAVSHLLSYKASFTTLAAGAATTLALPANYSSIAQLTAPTASAYDANSEPQNGLRFFISRMVVRDTTALNVGASGAASITLQSNSVNGTQQNTTLALVTGAAAVTAGSYAVIDVTQVGSLQTLTSVTAANASLILSPTSTVQFVYVGGTASTAGLQAGFTVDLFGHWIQGI